MLTTVYQSLRYDTPSHRFSNDSIKIYKKSHTLNMIPYIYNEYTMKLNNVDYMLKKRLYFSTFSYASLLATFFSYRYNSRMIFGDKYIFNMENKILFTSSYYILFYLCTSKDKEDYIFLVDKKLYTDPNYVELKKAFKTYIINPNPDIELIFTDDIEKMFLVDDFYPTFKSFKEEQEYLKKEEQEFKEYLQSRYG